MHGWLSGGFRRHKVRTPLLGAEWHTGDVVSLRFAAIRFQTTGYARLVRVLLSDTVMKALKRISILGALFMLVTACKDGGLPWADDSESIDLRCGSFFDGSMRFVAKRSELNAKQLTLLSALRETSAAGTCPEDNFGCGVSITDSIGVQTTYTTASGDTLCSHTHAALAYDSFKPFLETIECAYAKSGPETLSKDKRCYDGIFSPADGASIVKHLSTTEGEPLHVELDDCTSPNRIGNVTLQVFKADGTTLVGEGTPVTDPGPDNTCLALDVSAPANAVVVVTTSPAFLPAGDFVMRVW